MVLLYHLTYMYDEFYETESLTRAKMQVHIPMKGIKHDCTSINRHINLKMLMYPKSNICFRVPHWIPWKQLFREVYIPYLWRRLSICLPMFKRRLPVCSWMF